MIYEQSMNASNIMEGNVKIEFFAWRVNEGLYEKKNFYNRKVAYLQIGHKHTGHLAAFFHGGHNGDGGAEQQDHKGNHRQSDR